MKPRTLIHELRFTIMALQCFSILFTTYDLLLIMPNVPPSVIQINMCKQQMFMRECDQLLHLYKNKGSSEYFAQPRYSSANSYTLLF